VTHIAATQTVAAGPAWWHDAVVYEIYIRSFADSDGDGVGDLEGIRTRLPYLADLGVDAVWITPFYPSPMHDHGYDVADYCDIDPQFGQLDDFDKLLVDAHALGLRIVVDIVPNHTSNEHPWFADAISGPESAKRDWYIFRDPAPAGGPPNNWVSVFGGPAWTLDEKSGQYYLHLFDSSQPDLNWRNPAVHDAFRDVLRFWFDRGVDGFRIDVAHGLYKDELLRDNVKPGKSVPGTEHLHSVGAGNYWDQPETLGVWREWRQVADGYDDRMFVGEVFLFDMERVSAYVGPTLLHQSFNFLVAATAFEAGALRETVERSLSLFLREGTTPTWVLSNHDLVRHATRYGGGVAGVRRARAATALLLALPGSPYLYQGEELGLEQSEVPPEARQDPIWHRTGKPGRDGCRTPMPWTSDPGGYGFTSGSPWLPFDRQAATRNVEGEGADDTSTLAFYQSALATRRALAGRLSADVSWLDAPDGHVALSRAMADGSGALVVLVNCGERAGAVRLPVTDAAGRPTVLLSSGEAPDVGDGVVVVPAETTVWLELDDQTRLDNQTGLAGPQVLKGY
jgi:alpha-glucosidase